MEILENENIFKRAHFKAKGLWNKKIVALGTIQL